MKYEINNIIDKHKGKPAFVMGLGKSLDKYLPRLQEFKSRGMVLLSCNQWYQIQGMIADYWVTSNSDDTVKNLYQHMNEKKAMVMYAESVENTDRQFVADNLKVDYIAYEERHFNDEPYHRTLCRIDNCCDRIIPGRLTIQEELKKYTGYYEMNRMVCTVVEHLITFAILMGCNPIYVIGVELDYAVGYAGGLINHNLGGGFAPHLKIILDNFRILRRHAEKVGSRIINISDKPTFNQFEIGTI